MFVYEAAINKEEESYHVEFNDFGAAYADGTTVVEAIKAAAETLQLALAEYLDTGMKIPEPSFRLSDNEMLRIAIAVDVTPEFIERTNCVTTGEAAKMLGLSKGRITHMLNAGILQAVPYGNDRLVTLASINERLKNPREAGRPRKKVEVPDTGVSIKAP